MKKYIALVIIVMSSTMVQAAETVEPVFDGRKWELGWSGYPDAKANDKVFDEYVISGEKVDNWSELVTIQSFPGAQNNLNLDILEAETKINIMTVCPNAQWDSTEQQANERIWQFTIKGCAGQPEQSEIARAVKTDEGIHIFHYAIKKAPMPMDVKNTWLNNLKAFKINKK